MSLITETNELAAFCARREHDAVIAVDTEFIREKTYWPQLCLVQIAGADEARCIDTLAPAIDLAPLHALMANLQVLKVFHSARQDIEILIAMTGAVPVPLFDTQVAAMVCGFGDSVGYETLVNTVTGGRLDKTMRFTDWSQRPLTDRQIQYAMADVTHLLHVHEFLMDRLEKENRLPWVEEEMVALTDPASYRIDPYDLWRRLKPRSSNPRFLAILRELAAWRESEAQSRNLPRQRILRDDALLEVASLAPSSPDDLHHARLVSKGAAEGRHGQEMLAAVARGAATPLVQCPVAPGKKLLPDGMTAMMGLLRVLLKMRCDQHDVAQKLVASAEDLEKMTFADESDVPALHGWRREIFGADALRIKQGDVALVFSPRERRVKLMPVKRKG